jgi:pSer/pThr/pTyr-binding forkhead associated (FHA) protein
VIRKNGGYFIKDLGSTNGIDFNGTRVDNKRIEEGDVYSLVRLPAALHLPVRQPAVSLRCPDGRRG